MYLYRYERVKLMQKKYWGLKPFEQYVNSSLNELYESPIAIGLIILMDELLRKTFSKKLQPFWWQKRKFFVRGNKQLKKENDKYKDLESRTEDFLRMLRAHGYWLGTIDLRIYFVIERFP